MVEIIISSVGELVLPIKSYSVKGVFFVNDLKRIQLDLLNGFIAGCNVKMINLAPMLVFLMVFLYKDYQKTD